jgi:hypothetical protein
MSHWLAAAALAALCIAPRGEAQARPAHPRHHVQPRTAGGIFIDVRPLLARGLGPYAQQVRVDLARALAQEFPSGLPAGQRLVATIDSVFLTSWTGQMDSDFLGPSDSIDGWITLYGADGSILLRQNIATELPAWSGGAWYLQGNELRRTAALTRAFAGWTRRYVGG